MALIVLVGRQGIVWHMKRIMGGWLRKGFVKGMRELGRDMAGTGAGKLVGVNKESSVGIARVQREHPVVDKLLCALGLVAGGEQTAGAVGEQAGLQPGGLGVVVVTIAVTLGDVLQDDPPVALNIDGPGA